MTQKTIKTVVVDIEENCYLYYGENKECLIIDPGSRPKEIISTIKGLQLKPLAILLTHGHFDHIGAVDELRKEYKIECYIHSIDRYFFADAHMNGSRLLNLSPVVVKPADKLIDNDEELRFNNFKIKALHTPGHTSGGVCYYDAREGVVFTGDTLFKQGVGRSDLYSGDRRQLIKSIREKLLVLPEDTVVLPGHGPSSTIKRERYDNPYL